MINNNLFRPFYSAVVAGFPISFSKSFPFPSIPLYVLLCHLFFYIFPFPIYFSISMSSLFHQFLYIFIPFVSFYPLLMSPPPSSISVSSFFYSYRLLFNFPFLNLLIVAVALKVTVFIPLSNA